MNLSRVILERGGQRAILQGMIHIGPDDLYERLQSEVDWAVRNKYKIFFEGIRKKPNKKISSLNERKIRKFFNLIFDLYPVFASSLGISLQKEKITYPKDAINADITFSEFTKRLDSSGFKCGFLLWTFKSGNKKDLKRMIEKEMGNKRLSEIMKENKKLLSKIIFWIFFRKAMPVIMEYRNEIAVSIIEEISNGRNIFVHYGEKHIKGLVKLLRECGWIVKETTYINLKEFC